MDHRAAFAVWAAFGRPIELPLQGLRELTALRQTLQRVERELVSAARDNRSTWQEIGDALELSRQAAFTRHRPSVKAADGDSPRSSA